VLAAKKTSRRCWK